MNVQSGHHNHSIECTLFLPWYSWWLYKVDITIIVSNVPCSFPILWWWCPLCTIISCIRERTRYIRYYDCDVRFVHSSAISGIVQSGHHHHSIECTLFLPWYSWWLYKVYITIIVSKLWWWCPLCTIISCIRERTRYIRYYDCDVHFVQSSAISGKEQGTFDTMIVMYTLYNHQLYPLI
jgi:hypothetical protein